MPSHSTITDGCSAMSVVCRTVHRLETLPVIAGSSVNKIPYRIVAYIGTFFEERAYLSE